MLRRHFLAGSASLLLPVAKGEALAQPASGAVTPPALSEMVLADYAANMTYDRLPQDVVTMIKRQVIDTLACAMGAATAEPVRIVEQTFRQSFNGPAVASIIGGKTPMSTEGAALINGVMVRYLDLNDIYAGSEPAHPSECIPAAIACCEETGRSGHDLITAIAIGYETQLALIDAVAFGSRAFHSVSCAGLVTPLIAGKAWGLTAAQMANGMGISGPKQMTLLAINSGPISMIKALVYPSGAMEGIFAARLARNGFTGAAGVMEWFVQKTQGRTTSFTLDIRPDRFRILNVGLKRFPLQFELQTIAEAGIKIRSDLKGDVSGIHDILVETSASAKAATAGPSRYEPATKETADHSLPVCLALALLDGDVTVAQFDSGRWQESDVLALARKVRVEAAPDNGRDRANAGARVRATLEDGRIKEQSIDVPEGNPHRPMSEASLTSKFMQFAEPLLGRARAEDLLAVCHRLETLDSVRDLTRLLTA